MLKFPAQAQIRGVGLRDGLQSVPGILSTHRKIEWVTDAYSADMRAIEVGSFVPAHRLPQLADTVGYAGPAALQTGVTRFDASLAGIGGCQHAPGASGNAASEDLAFMLQSIGVETGVDIAALLSLRGKLATWLSGETLHGSLWRAGLPKTSVKGARHGSASGIPSP